MTEEQQRRKEFEAWWENTGQFVRAGGGKYEISFAYAAWKAAQAPLLKRIEELESDISEAARLNEKLAGILSKTAMAMRGSEPKLTMWGWDDLPDRAAEQTELLKRAQEELADYMSEMTSDHAHVCCHIYGLDHAHNCTAKALHTDIANHLEANNENR